MKTAASFLVCSGFFWLLACQPDIPTPPVPVVNVDSLVCDQTWRQFHLAKDSVLILRYNQETAIIVKSDTLKLKIIAIQDQCSAESAKLTYGCRATVGLSLQLNSKCSYTTVYPLFVQRYGTGDGPNDIKITEASCNTNSSIYIENGPASGALVYYNQLFHFRRLYPFAKTDSELQSFSRNKDIYTIVFYLKVRCF
ncbi:MAG: hypothetical protein LH606_20710 [Cytophagaceae bacterium]|nr:hypothetical protein [Cytophagaceae bacterium]